MTEKICPFDPAIICYSDEQCCGCEDYNSEYADKCVLTCLGLPTSALQPGSVKRLVEALEPFAKFACDCGVCFNCKARAALAPFKG